MATPALQLVQVRARFMLDNDTFIGEALAMSNDGVYRVYDCDAVGTLTVKHQFSIFQRDRGSQWFAAPIKVQMGALAMLEIRGKLRFDESIIDYSGIHNPEDLSGTTMLEWLRHYPDGEATGSSKQR